MRPSTHHRQCHDQRAQHRQQHIADGIGDGDAKHGGLATD
jgi:hypothetical protein